MKVQPGNCISNASNAKSSRELLKAKPFLNKQFLLSLYYSYIHRYINYASVASVSTYMTNFKKLSSQKSMQRA